MVILHNNHQISSVLQDIHYSFMTNLKFSLETTSDEFLFTSVFTPVYLFYFQMIGDRLFVVDAERSARWMSKSTKAPVYFYYLTAPVTSTTIKEKFRMNLKTHLLLILLYLLLHFLLRIPGFFFVSKYKHILQEI